jgi:hypothetical protein
MDQGVSTMPHRTTAAALLLSAVLAGCAGPDVKKVATETGAAIGFAAGIAAAAVTRQSGFWAYDLSAKGGALAGAAAGYLLGEAEEEARRRGAERSAPAPE